MRSATVSGERAPELIFANAAARSSTAAIDAGYLPQNPSTASPTLYGDMSVEVQRDVASLGFSWACSTEGGFVEQPNIYALARIAVPNAPTRTLIGLMTSPR